MFSYATTILDSVVSSCCFGQGKKENKVFEKVKGDIKELTEQELEHLKAFLLRPMRQKGVLFLNQTFKSSWRMKGLSLPSTL